MSIEFKDSGLTPSAYYRFESGALTTDSSGNSHTLTAIEGVVDSYSETNQDNLYNLYGASRSGFAQSFTCSNAVILSSCKFYIKKQGSPTGNAVAKLYAHSGTYGTNSVPTGTALATSGTFDVSTLTTSYQLITFNFTGVNQYAMAASTYYVISIEYSGGSSGNELYVGDDESSPSHGGNSATYNGSSWTAVAGADAIFYVYGIPTEGTGKFGGGALFSGANAYSIADHADFKPTVNFTIGGWFKSTDTSGASTMLFQSFAYAGSVYAGFNIEIETDGKIDATAGDNTGNTFDVNKWLNSGNTVVDDNVLHFVVLTWNGTSYQLYVDGVADCAAKNGNAPAYQATNYVRVGCQNNTGTNIQFVNAGAVLDDWFLINGTALSAAQILNIYQNYVLAADAGSFVLTGKDSILTRGYTLTAEVGSFILTGISAILTRGYTLAAGTGSFILTGIDAIFTRGYTLVAEAGSFILTGFTAILKRYIKRIIWSKPAGINTLWSKPTSTDTSWSKPTTENTDWKKEDY